MTENLVSVFIPPLLIATRPAPGVAASFDNGMSPGEKITLDISKARFYLEVAEVRVGTGGSYLERA